MADRVFNVLFLCTGNSARSIMAEAILNKLGVGRFKAFSAGSCPKGDVHPLALHELSRLGFPIDGLSSKNWDVFATPNAPQMDFIITACDNAAGEMCPIWPGKPVTAHWGIEDPAAVMGSEAEKRSAFRTALRELESRIRPFVSLPLQSLDRLELQSRLDLIGSASSSRTGS